MKRWMGVFAAAAVMVASNAWAIGAGPYDTNSDEVLDVLVIYDATGPFADLGPIYGEMLLNLLGHFPEVSANAIETADYAGGDMLTAEVTFYIGSTYDNPLPQALKDDFWVNPNPLIWMGYNLWQIGWDDWNTFLLGYGFQHWYIAGNDGSGEDTEFYRYVQYKGQELPKFAWWNAEAGTFVNDPFTSILYYTDETAFETLATVVHSGTGDVQPYVIRSGNLTLWADIPFTFLHEQDRYLAAADLLHDHLGLDHEVSRKALMRLEDVHPKVSPADIRSVTNEMKRRRANRPWSIAMIPEYRDPLGYYNEGTPEQFTLNAREARAWRRQIRRAIRRGAGVVLHGWTHQYQERPNPYNGVSGDDFEFWLLPEDTPVPEDSYAWFADRMEEAQEILDRRRWLDAWAFEVPHYRASVADYLYTNDFYDTTYHRTVYYPYEVDLWGDVYTWNEIWNDPQVITDWDAAAVMVAGDRWGGQFVPYVIERDVYGSRIIPETLGNIEPAEFALGPQYVRLVPDLLANAEVNLVNRCAFASFFYHPYLMQFPEIPDAGGPLSFRALVEGIEALGYEFVQASEL